MLKTIEKETMTLKDILFRNVEISDKFGIAHLLNNIFTGIAAELEADIPTSHIDPLSLVSHVYALLFIYPFSVEECTNVIRKLKILRHVSINYS